MNIGEKTYRIDMKVIEPYKKVLSHGGQFITVGRGGGIPEWSKSLKVLPEILENLDHPRNLGHYNYFVN